MFSESSLTEEGSPLSLDERAANASTAIRVITRRDVEGLSLATEPVLLARPKARYFESQSTLHVTRGSILLRSHRGQRVLNTGDIYVCEPRELTLLATINEHPAVLRTLRVPAERGAYPRGSLKPAHVRNTRIPEAVPPRTFVSRLVAAFEQGDIDLVDFLLQSPVRATIVKNADEGAGPSRSRLPQTVRSIRSRILDDLGRTETLEELARALGTSARSVSRLFKMRLLVSVHKFRLCARITAATRYLVVGEGVATAARALGFVDESHLTKHFKRMLGVSPSAYAKAIVRLSARQLRPAESA